MRLNQRLGLPPDINLVPVLVERLAPAFAARERAALVRLRELSPPASVSRDWHTMLAYRAILAGQLVRYGRATRLRDGAAVGALAASRARALSSMRRVAERDGFRQCAKVGERLG
jgi:hypothetical protein